MIDTRFLDELARRIGAAVPPGLESLRRDLEKQARAVLQSAFARLDLVPREEFEIQAKVLARTRERLEALEARVRRLEREGAAGGPAPTAPPLDEEGKSPEIDMDGG
ncbi:MAG: accessory factor UbiK family protein [Gammaproteobacteria bacterium]|nr:MAG: accessory factor UbiK family protein [Gammaproteobacteria bacterium]